MFCISRLLKLSFIAVLLLSTNLFADETEIDNAIASLQGNLDVSNADSELNNIIESLQKKVNEIQSKKDVSEQFAEKSDTEKRNSKWNYKQIYDEVEDNIIVLSYLNSDNAEDTGFVYGKQRATVAIKNKQDTGILNDRIIVGFENTGLVDVCIDGCWLRVRFDDKPAKWYKAEYATPALYTIASDIDYINDDAQLKYNDDFLLNLYNSQKILIKLPLFNGNTITYRFDTKGLDKNRMGEK